MAEHRKLWYQGTNPLRIPKCDGKPEFTCPESKRIAAEYMREWFTLTNVINPNVSYDNIGHETWLFKELKDVKVGDYLWLLLVPPMHRLVDVFGYNAATFTEDSDLATMGGITLTLVTGEFKAADKDGNCTMSGEQEHGTLVMPATPDPKQQFTVDSNVNLLNDTETWRGVGFKVDALPNNKTIADIIGKIVIGTHVLAYDAQTYM